MAVIWLYELFKFKSMIDHVHIDKDGYFVLQNGDTIIRITLHDYAELQRVYESLVWFKRAVTMRESIIKACDVCGIPYEHYGIGWIIGDKVNRDSA